MHGLTGIPYYAVYRNKLRLGLQVVVYGMDDHFLSGVFTSRRGVGDKPMSCKPGVAVDSRFLPVCRMRL